MDKLPEGMRVIFYPKSEEGRKVESYLCGGRGRGKVPPGRYDMVIYNYNTESVLIRKMRRMRRLRLIHVIAKGLKQVRRWCGHRTLYM